MSVTMLSDICEEILIGVHADVPPSDRDWDAWLAISKRGADVCKGVLVFTDGTGPNSVQRAKLDGLRSFKRTPTAIVTTSALARGIVTAISWLGKNIRAFAPARLDEAFEYVGVAPSARPTVIRKVAALRMRLVGNTIDTLEVRAMSAAQVERLMESIVTERLSRVRERASARLSERPAPQRDE